MSKKVGTRLIDGFLIKALVTSTLLICAGMYQLSTSTFRWGLKGDKMLLTVKDQAGVEWDVDFQEELYVEENVLDKWLESIKLKDSDIEMYDYLDKHFINTLLALAVEEKESCNPRAKLKTKRVRLN